MLENFLIQHTEQGHCVFTKSFSGTPLPLDVISGFTSYLSTLFDAASSPASSSSTRRGSQAPSASSPPPSSSASASSTTPANGTTHTSSSTSGGGGGEELHSHHHSAAAPAAIPGASLHASLTRTCAIRLGKSLFVCLPLGPFLLIAQGAAQDSEAHLAHFVDGVCDQLTLYLGRGEFLHTQRDQSAGGGSDAGAENVLDVVDIIDSFLTRSTMDVTYLLQGSRQMIMTSEQLDGIVDFTSKVELLDGVVGTMLSIGRSVLHSRLSVKLTRQVVQHLEARPMQESITYTLPVFSAKRWHNLVLFRIRRVVFSVLLRIDADLAPVLKQLAHFEEELVAAGVELPAEELPSLLRHYTGHETIAFAYKHKERGFVVAPTPRAGPSSQLQSLEQTFTWFYSRALDVLLRGSMNVVVLRGKGFLYVAQSQSGYELHAMFSEQTEYGAAFEYMAEIAANVERYNTAMVV